MTPDVEDIYTLAPLQAGLLLHSLRDDDPTLFVNQLVCRLSGTLDEDALRRGYTALVEGNPVLRTSYHAGALEHPVQVVHRRVELVVDTVDLGSCADPETRLTQTLRADRERGFGLDRPPLSRLTRVILPGGRNALVWTFHHLLLDGWSTHLLLGDLFAAYDAAYRGRTVDVPPRRPYRDYIAWLDRQDTAAAEEFVRRELAGTAAPTALAGVGRPDDLPAGAVRMRTRELTLPADATRRIEAAARQARVTLSTLLHAAWGLLQCRYNGRLDAVFGTTFSLRPPELSGADAMAGILINVLPMRVRVRPDQTVEDWLAGLHRSLLGLRQHAHLPLSAAVATTGLPAGTPLFDSALVVENYPIDTSRWTRASVAVEHIEYHERTNHPLCLLAIAGDELGLHLTHDRARCSDVYADLLLNGLAALLTALADALGDRAGGGRLMTVAELAAATGGPVPDSGPGIVLLDALGSVPPLGAPGELCLGEPALVPGFELPPDEAARHFVPHPRPRTPGERLYRTGRHARAMPDGSIEVLPVPAEPAEPAGDALIRAADDTPSTPDEKALADLFTALLGVEQVGLHDDFFELGGTSLASIRLVTQAGGVLGTEIPLEALFTTPTVAGLLAAVRDAGATNRASAAVGQ
ncbi:condensation domain-containing protein [Streptomyces griseoruber]|uniref:condensation domain-containing protein n=1 Tax=Streptomyces griseoruber TaxID=1943 RepID=UPI0006E1B502|nr:condensation domain-containing protein [Streptomyces griseoruber]